MVGQRLLSLLSSHPWFEVTTLAASKTSGGKTYEEAVKDRWMMEQEIPLVYKAMIIDDISEKKEKIAKHCNLIFSCLSMEKEQTKQVEQAYATLGSMVISTNSAHRFTPDVPMIIPEVNAHHLTLLTSQRKKRGWRGGIVVKPNCSIQSYVIILTALKDFGIERVCITSLQAISGAGKTFRTFPEIIDNVIPFIEGEEEKSEKEPLKIWGTIKDAKIIACQKPIIQATCVRIPVSNGHMALVSVDFKKRPTKEGILEAISFYNRKIELPLPSSPKRVITYFEYSDRPQTKRDKERENGMGITMGRLREGKLFDYSFTALSHNTLRGAAGGAVLIAELLVQKGYVQ
jgi:aspartate-semialdehyde dehydrogenase